MANEEVTTRFNVDISELKKSMQDAQRQIRLANAEFRAASARMDDWKTSTEGVQAKLRQLDTTLTSQRTILQNLSQQYAQVSAEQGSNSRAAQELAIRIANQRAAIGNTEREINNYREALEELERESDDASDGSDDLTNNVRDAGQEAGKAESGFTVLKGALASLVAEGIKAAISGLKDLSTELINDSTNAYAQFAAATGTATDAMGEYEEAIKNVYKNNFGESLEDVATKMAKVKEVTGELDASKLQEMTEKAITLEDTFGMDMTETLRGVNSLMTHFGMTSTEAFDLISSGAQNGLNYTDELGDNVAEYAGKFAEAGYSSEEYFQLLQNGSQGGAYNLDKVNDAINEVTARLADGTIGESIKGFSGETQELFKAWKHGEATQKEVIDSIVKDIQNTTGEQKKMNLAALAFGTMAEDGGTKFIESLSPVGDTFKDVKGKADELAAVKYDTPQAALQGIGRTLKTDLLQPLVDKLMPKLNEFADWVTENLPTFIDKVKELAGKAKEFATELEKWTPLIVGVGTAIAAYFVVGQISSFVTWIKSGAAALKMMEIAQLALNIAMNLNPIGLIVAAIAGLVAAFVLLWNKSETFREFWIGLWEGIKEACGTAIDAIGKFFTETLPEFFDTAINWVKENWQSLLGFLINPFVGLFMYFYNNNEKFREFVDNAIKHIKELPGKLWEKFKLAIAKVAAFFKDILEKAKTKATEFVTNMIDKIKALPGKLWEKFTEAIGKVTSFFSDILEKAKTKASEFVTNMIDKIKALPGKMWEKFLLTIAKVVSLGNDLKTKATEAGKKLIDGIIDKVKGLPDDIKEIGKNIVSGLWNGINDKFKWLTDKIKSFATDVTDKIKDFFGIHSPSRVMRDQVGKYLALGVAEGITKNKDAVNDAMQALASDASQPLNLGIKNAKATINTSGAKNAINGANTASTSNSYTFNQYNTSPKALNRLDIYRQTKNQLNFAKGV